MRQEGTFAIQTGQVSSRPGVAILTEKKDGKVAPGPNYITVGRNLAMELVRVTEVFARHLGFLCCRVLAFIHFLCCTVCSVTCMMLPCAIGNGTKLSIACRLPHWQAGAGWERRALVSHEI